MWSHGRAEQIKSFFGMRTPVLQGFVDSVFEGLVSALNSHHLGAEQSHLLHVRTLACHVGCPHVNRARHLHQGAHCGRCNAVLPSTGLSNDALFPHVFGQQNLPDGIVDLVCSRVVEVLSFQINLAAVQLAQRLREIERRGAADIVAQQHVEFFAEILALNHFPVAFAQGFNARTQDFWDVGTAVVAEKPFSFTW